MVRAAHFKVEVKAIQFIGPKMSADVCAPPKSKHPTTRQPCPLLWVISCRGVVERSCPTTPELDIGVWLALSDPLGPQRFVLPEL